MRRSLHPLETRAQHVGLTLGVAMCSHLAPIWEHLRPISACIGPAAGLSSLHKAIILLLTFLYLVFTPRHVAYVTSNCCCGCVGLKSVRRECRTCSSARPGQGKRQSLPEEPIDGVVEVGYQSTQYRINGSSRATSSAFYLVDQGTSLPHRPGYPRIFFNGCG